jgi:hypothetical protein
MNIGFSAFDHVHLLGEFATYPLARLVARRCRPRSAASSLRGRHTPRRTIERAQLRFLG